MTNRCNVREFLGSGLGDRESSSRPVNRRTVPGMTFICICCYTSMVCAFELNHCSGLMPSFVLVHSKNNGLTKVGSQSLLFFFPTGKASDQQLNGFSPSSCY
jgi:hypothetical protein